MNLFFFLQTKLLQTKFVRTRHVVLFRTQIHLPASTRPQIIGNQVDIVIYKNLCMCNNLYGKIKVSADIWLSLQWLSQIFRCSDYLTII